jgi:predicted RNA-binding protein (virulence factor B family)
MVQAGQWNKLAVVKAVDFGLYLDGGEAGEILLPKRFAPDNANPGEELEVFIYHDSDNRLIATTQKPAGVVGDIVYLKAVDITNQGAFMDWGLMKDIFVPLSQQTSRMSPGGRYLVGIYLDEQTGRVAATEKFDRWLDNGDIDLKEKQPVDLLVWRASDIGYVVIIDNKYTGVLHFNEMYRDLDPGDRLKGFVKAIREGGKIDVAPGEAGYARVEDATQKVLRLLGEHNGYLPYNDKSDPDEIHDFFGMSKKTFKMTTGGLYKAGKIEFTKTGIRVITN